MTDLKTDFIETLLSLEDIPQSPKWHPEGNTLEHVKFIIYGLTFKEEMRIITPEEAEFLTFVALFHDLGKIDTFTVDEKGIPHAYGHENYAKEYIEKYQDLLPDSLDVEKLKKFCKYHMKAHQYLGTQMRETKKVAFRDKFDEDDFHLLMTFESCDSAHTLYDMLRRTPEHVSVGYMEPIEFFDEIRVSVPWFDNEVFVQMFEGMSR